MDDQTKFLIEYKQKAEDTKRKIILILLQAQRRVDDINYRKALETIKKT